jgi:hypothetical protein
VIGKLMSIDRVLDGWSGSSLTKKAAALGHLALPVAGLVGDLGLLRSQLRSGSVRPGRAGGGLRPDAPPWPVNNLKLGGVVEQISRWSCVEAGGEMIVEGTPAEGLITQSSLLDEIRAHLGNDSIGATVGTLLDDFVTVANGMEPGIEGDGKSWVAGERWKEDLRGEIESISTNGPWMAEFIAVVSEDVANTVLSADAVIEAVNDSTLKAKNVVDHAVVVDGLSEAGEILIRDPAGYTYTMALAVFDQLWSGLYVMRR